MESFKKSRLETDTPVVSSRSERADGLLHVSELNRRLQELIAQYIQLEEYYMTESLRKACSLDEPLEDSLTSSVVDHVFFVLQKCSNRSLVTCNLNAICAIVNIIINALNRDFGEVPKTACITIYSSQMLQRSLQDQLSRSVSASLVLNRGSMQPESKISVNVRVQVAAC
jgi:hypothetical protein